MKAGVIVSLAASATASVISIGARSGSDQLIKRQAQTVEEGLKACDNKDIPCTIVSASTDKMNFGSKKPRDIADELWEKCLANGCDVNQWEIDTHTLTGLGQSNDKIKATAHGNFAPEFRHALVWAMTELVGGTQEPYRWTEDRPPVSGGGKLGMDAFRGPKDYHINRFAWDDDHWESQSFISLSLERKEDGKAECESLFGVLEKVAGMLNGEVGSIVGSAKGACAAL